MERKKLILCLGLILVVGVSEGLPDGAPDSICSSMTPQHKGLAVQPSEPRYVVEAIKMKNGRVRVRISSTIGEELQGFALQARSGRDRSRPVEGHFTAVDGVSRTEDCFRGADNMLTHINPSSKREVVTEWTPNVRTDQDVVFRATVAKNFATFWTEVDSEPMRIAGSITVGSRTTPEAQAKKQLEEEAYDKVFEDCFKHKGCFGMPSGCIGLRNCLVLLTYAHATAHDSIAFHLHSRIRTRTYIAAGLSQDSKMGDDLVTECIRLDAAETGVRESWNSGKRNAVDLEGRTHGRYKHRARYVDGVLTCSWETNLSFDLNGVRFDLENSTHILLAEGPMNLDRKGIHRNKLASPGIVNFTAFEMLGEAGIEPAIKVHGALMVTAWIGFVSLGIFFARYFKDGWPGRTMCNEKVWFALHRCCMLLSLLCVGVSVIIIFVHYNGWNSGSTHSILGVVTVVLGFLQPILANFRPDPESPKRPIFNWLHMSVGTLAHVFSLITLYVASKMESAGLDKSFYWVLTIFVVVYLFFHVLLQGHLWKTKGKRITEINMLNMNRNRDTDHSVVQKHDDRSIFHVHFRIILLCIYAFVLLSIVVSLYVVIGKA